MKKRTAELPERIRRYDVVRIDVEYEGLDGHKKMPVAIMIVGDGPSYVGVKITSKAKYEKGDVWLVEPSAANLTDGVARCAQLVSFDHRDIVGYYGHLDNADINLIVGELSKLDESDFIHLRVH